MRALSHEMARTLLSLSFRFQVSFVYGDLLANEDDGKGEERAS